MSLSASGRYLRLGSFIVNEASVVAAAPQPVERSDGSHNWTRLLLTNGDFYTVDADIVAVRAAIFGKERMYTELCAECGEPMYPGDCSLVCVLGKGTMHARCHQK